MGLPRTFIGFSSTDIKEKEKKGAVPSKVQIAAFSFKVNLYGICS